MNPSPDWVLFLGRFHPLLVHFPIALIVLLGCLEVLARFPKFRQASHPVGPILLIAVPGSILTAVLGWLLSRAGGYQESLLQWHFWTAIATASACTLAGFLYWLNFRKAYRVTLGVTLLALVITSHYGGSLTHGSDYLVRYAPPALRFLFASTPAANRTNATPVLAAQDDSAPFSHVILPMLDKHCVGCHGPEKAKGGLRLDSLALAQQGGESGPGLIPGKAAASLVLQRVQLPVDHDDHMPPDGKPQLSDEDLALLQWWTDSADPAGKVPASRPPPALIAQALQTRLGSAIAANTNTQLVSSPEASLPDIDAIMSVADGLAAELGIAFARLGENEAWLHCNAGIANSGFSDAELAKLAPIASRIRWLDLAGTRITDAGLVHLRSMTNLTRLHLQRTAITDSGLHTLKPLRQLTYLNLYGTAITDKALAALQELPELRSLYLWGTGVTPEAARLFAESRTDKAQIQHLQKEIANLQAQILRQQFVLELGRTDAVVSSAPPAPINSVCPVSGKPVLPDKTVLHGPHLVAFCCDVCLTKFQQDPKPFLSTLILSNAPTATARSEARNR